jgi:hypothetical protein
VPEVLTISMPLPRLPESTYFASCSTPQLVVLAHGTLETDTAPEWLTGIVSARSRMTTSQKLPFHTPR